MSADRKEMYAKVAETLIAMMREGIAPWSKPWACTGVNDVNAPHNGATGRYYRGFNRMYLGVVMFEQGWTDPRFMTYKQAKEQGVREYLMKPVMKRDMSSAIRRALDGN